MFFVNIKDMNCNSAYRLRYWNPRKILYLWRIVQRIAIVLTACGIETNQNSNNIWNLGIAIVLTACGIETDIFPWTNTNCYDNCNSAYRLRYWNRPINKTLFTSFFVNCNSAYRLRYWNLSTLMCSSSSFFGHCNSAYRLRYWNTTICKARSVESDELYCNSAYRLRYWNISNVWQCCFQIIKLQ